MARYELDNFEFEEKVIFGFISSVGLRLPAVRGEGNIRSQIIELHPTISALQGVCLHDIYHAWLQADVDVELLLAKTGWSRQAVDTIGLYEGKQNHFAFATLAEVLDVFANYFHKESIYFPRYELGERCPIVVFSPN